MICRLEIWNYVIRPQDMSKNSSFFTRLTTQIHADKLAQLETRRQEGQEDKETRRQKGKEDKETRRQGDKET